MVTGDQQPRVAQNILGVDKYTSIRQAAKAYNVPRSTLADRQHGKPPRSAAHEQQQRLTPAQEEFLTEWILEQDLQGLAPSHTRVREMAKIYSPENTWNMDEAGTALGSCTNSMVLGDSQKKRTYIQSPQDREWASMVETVSALGRSTRPVAIFKRKNPTNNLVPTQ